MRFRASNVGAMLLSIFVLAACANTSVLEIDAPPGTVVLDETYQLGPGDELNIVVFNHEDLSGKFLVSETGAISLPLIGKISAAGRNTNAVQQDYSEHLANGYILNPKVSVSISAYRPFFIIGGVQKPGAYPYKVGMTIVHAIAIAGGHSARARKRAPPLIKRAPGSPGSGGPPTVYTQVFPGDIVEIPEKFAEK